MKQRTKTLLNSLVKFLFSGGIIVWLVVTGRLDVQVVWRLFQNPLMLFGLLLMGINLWMASERWRILVAPQELQTSRWEIFRLTLIGIFFNHAMPGGVGGDVIKAYYFTKDHPRSRATAITSVILDRALGLYAMAVMALFVMAWDFEHVRHVHVLLTFASVLAVLVVGLSLAWFFLFSRRVRAKGWVQQLLQKLPLSAKLLKLYETAHRFGLYRRNVLGALALSVCSQAIAVCFLWLAGVSAGRADVSLGTYFLIAPLGYMATAIPLSPAGIGIGQAAFYMLFNLYQGQTSDLGPTVITAQQVVTALFGLWGAYFYVRRKDPLPDEEIIEAGTAESI